MNENKTMWMVRAGRKGVYFGEFESGKMVAIGWHLVGDMSQMDSEAVRAAVDEHYSGTPQQVGQQTGILDRFRAEIKRGDGVITYNNESREYLIGEISGDYKYEENQSGLAHRREVEWKGKISRDVLTDSLKNSLGGLATLFEIKEQEHKAEILRILQKDTKDSAVPSVDDSDDAVAEDATINLVENARLKVEDKIAKMSWGKMEQLVAALFRAMGHVATVTSATKDGGYDVYASPDGLMLEEPRIRAEVKHRAGAVGRPDMQKFIQAKGEARGVFISTGGFNGDARTEARNNEIVALDLGQFAELIIKHYDNFDGEGCALLPMKKLYIPLN